MPSAGGAHTMRARHPQSVPRHGRSKVDLKLRTNILPGLALAGGVLIAALIALVLIGGGGSGNGSLPSETTPGAVRLFPSEVASRVARPRVRHRPAGGSAAESQYGAAGDRGTVLGGP
jgi:hypothetical protein